MQMEGSDVLLVGAEISVAFAGFSGIIATYQGRFLLRPLWILVRKAQAKDINTSAAR
jgi:hypothetical protein